MLDCVKTCVSMLTIYFKRQTVFDMIIFKLPVVDKKMRVYCVSANNRRIECDYCALMYHYCFRITRSTANGAKRIYSNG